MAEKRILLIVGGGIAAYKSLELTRLLKKAGLGVRAILTRAGEKFVTPMSLAALTGEPLRLSLDLDLQTALEEVVAKGMTEMSAKGAVGILMEADTGRIRAMASLPDFDPNLRPALPLSGDPADSVLFNRASERRMRRGAMPDSRNACAVRSSIRLNHR